VPGMQFSKVSGLHASKKIGLKMKNNEKYFFKVFYTFERLKIISQLSLKFDQMQNLSNTLNIKTRYFSSCISVHSSCYQKN
jgi:hypothetical protein